LSQKNLIEPFYFYNTLIIFTGVLFWLLITTILLYHNADGRQSTNCKKLRDSGDGAVGSDNIKWIQFIYVYGTSKISDENIYHSRRLYSSNRWWRSRVFFFTENRVRWKSDVGNYNNNIVDILQQQPPAEFTVINYYVYFCYCVQFEIDQVLSPAAFFFIFIFFFE